MTFDEKAAREWATEATPAMDDHFDSDFVDTFRTCLASSVLGLVREQREEAWCRGHGEKSETAKQVAYSMGRDDEREAIVRYIRNDVEQWDIPARFVVMHRLTEVEHGDHLEQRDD